LLLIPRPDSEATNRVGSVMRQFSKRDAKQTERRLAAELQKRLARKDALANADRQRRQAARIKVAEAAEEPE
jgi:hypothetical protein